jgi:hypothetical protein
MVDQAGGGYIAKLMGPEMAGYGSALLLLETLAKQIHRA